MHSNIATDHLQSKFVRNGLVSETLKAHSTWSVRRSDILPYVLLLCLILSPMFQT